MRSLVTPVHRPVATQYCSGVGVPKHQRHGEHLMYSRIGVRLITTSDHTGPHGGSY